MSSAILYVRVSTEEQANKGYSLKHQEDVLMQYCSLRNISVSKAYIEDHSAKSFNRPAWKKLMAEIDVKKTKSDLVLFTRWDRFSRNTGDSYSMIRMLQNLGVQPQAIEQPLDLSVPENKMMLAFYLAVPEVENDRRGLNIKYGMHKAKEEGRWLGPAPLGYSNQCTIKGDKYIIPKEPEASIIKYAFEQIASGKLNVNLAYLQAVKHGLKCSRSNFFLLLRNPVYAGYIKVKSLDKASICNVPAQHRRIISLSMFEEVLARITHKKLMPQHYKSFRSELLLKGFIGCPVCSRMLTGSGSTGRKGMRYFYYHCSHSCRFRIRTELVHKIFFKRLKSFEPPKKYADLYRTILLKYYEQKQQEAQTKHIKAQKGIERFADRISRLKSLLLDGYINFEEYNISKIDTQEKIEMLCNSIASCNMAQSDINAKVNSKVNEFYSPLVFFNNLTNELKQDFINNLLTRGWQWDETDLDSIFKVSVKRVYKTIQEDNLETIDSAIDECEDYLENLATIDVHRDDN